MGLEGGLHGHGRHRPLNLKAPPHCGTAPSKAPKLRVAIN
jgi:hypothetical protein